MEPSGLTVGDTYRMGEWEKVQGIGKEDGLLVIGFGGEGAESSE